MSMALTEIQARNAKPKDRPYPLAAGKGLRLLVKPNGSKLWQLRYRFDGKAKMLSFGDYPTTTVREANDKRDGARKLLTSGIDPSAARKAEKRERQVRATNTFETVAREWVESKRAGWAPDRADIVLSSLTRDAFPDLGAVPVAEITAPSALAAIRKVEARGSLEQASRIKQRISAVLRYAVATGRATSDPTRDLRGAPKSPEPVRHLAALRARDLPEFFVKLNAYDGHGEARRASARGSSPGRRGRGEQARRHRSCPPAARAAGAPDDQRQ